MNKLNCATFLTTIFFLTAGCGKSDDTMRMEMEEWAKIDSVHMIDMAFLKELMATDKTLEAALKSHDSLLAKTKKSESEHSGLDLSGAREKVQAAISAMNEVMPKLSQPDYAELKHEEVVKILEEQKALLDAVSLQMREASELAASVLKSHKAWATEHSKKKK
ncbi:MAG: hypothetical protein J0L62_12780 [Bacteroidetes bacterium]|nr:hypothetical protein [Bacteroidota bacterium]